MRDIGKKVKFKSIEEELEFLRKRVSDLEEAEKSWKELENKLAQSEASLRQIIDLVPHYIFAKDIHGRFLLANKAIAESYGTTVEELTGKTDKDFIPVAEADNFTSADQEVILSGQRKFIPEEVITDSKGNRHYLQTIKIPFSTALTEQQAVLGVSTDISQHKEIIFELSESEKKYRALYEYVPLAYQSLDENGRFLDVNPAWLRILGYDREEVIGKYFGDFLHPEWKKIFPDRFSKFKKAGYVRDVVFKMIHKKGNLIDVSFEGCIAYYPTGKVRQTYCVFHDITVKLKQEKEIKEQEAKLRALFNTMDEIVLEINSDGDYIDIAPTRPELLIVPPDQLLGQNIRDFFPSETANMFMENILKSLRQNETVELEYQINIKGVPLWFLARISPKTDSSVLYVAHDITKQKQTEEDLIKHREHLEDIVKERTRKLEDQKEDLERINSLFTGREFRIKELREKVKELKIKLSRFEDNA